MSPRPSPTLAAQLQSALLDQASEALFCIAFDPCPPADCSAAELLGHCLSSGRLVVANAAARRLFELDESAVTRLCDSGLRLDELPGLTPNGDRTVRLREVLEDSGAVQRVSESGRLQHILCRLNPAEDPAAAREAQQLQTAGLLVSGIAHDYHNLLTVMLGSAEIAMQQARQGDPTPHLEEIHAAARSAASLGQQLAALSYERDPELQSVELATLTRRSIGMLRRLLDPSTRLTLDFDPEVPRVHADPRHLEQALIGMVLSVRGALPVDASIVVTVGEDLEHELVRLTVRGDHPLAGSVDPEGPGLALARSVIERAGGRFSVEPQTADHGSQVLALLQPASGGPRPLAVAQAAAQAQGDGTVVLLVDDHDVLRHYMARLLRSSGYEVHAVSSADEALQLPREEREAFGLIVTDVLMPSISGPELVRRWRDAGLSTPAVFTSGASGSRGELERWLEEDWILIEKPFRNEELLAALRKARTD